MWKCPNCETINKDDICAVCGERRQVVTDVADAVPEQKGSGKKVAIILLCIIFLCLIGGGIYLFLLQPDPSPDSNPDFINEIEKAQVLIADKEYEQCKELIQEMKNSFSNYNESFDALYLEGYLNMELEAYNEAIRCFDKAMKVGFSVECLVNSAVCRAKTGKVDEAQKMLEENKSDDESKKYVEAEIAVAQNRVEDAIKGFEYVISNAKNEFLKKQAYISLAELYREKRHIDKDSFVYLDKQISVMEQAVRELKLEDDLTLTEMMGEAYFTSKDYELAVQKFERLLDLGYEREYIYNNIAIIYHQTGRFDDAERILNRMKERFPQSYQCYVRLAFLYIDMESRKDETERNYKKAVECYELAEKYTSAQQKSELIQLKRLIEELEEKGWLS